MRVTTEQDFPDQTVFEFIRPVYLYELNGKTVKILLGLDSQKDYVNLTYQGAELDRWLNLLDEAQQQDQKLRDSGLLTVEPLFNNFKIYGNKTKLQIGYRMHFHGQFANWQQIRDLCHPAYYELNDIMVDDPKILFLDPERIGGLGLIDNE